MLTATAKLKDSGLSPAAGAQRTNADASSERRREFEDLLSHVLPRFRRMALRSLRNPQDAEDAVQDAMLSAFRHISRFDGRSQMLTWLTAILINAVRMQIRRSSRRQLLSLDKSQNEGERTVADGW